MGRFSLSKLLNPAEVVFNHYPFGSDKSGLCPNLAAFPALPKSRSKKRMGRTLENKQQIVEEIKTLLNESEMAVVLDYKGLTIKEMSDLRSRLQANNGICKVTKNSLMRRAIDGQSNWNDLKSLLSGTNAFVLIKEDVGGAVKAIQSFQKETKKSETKGALFEGKLLSQSEIKEIADLPSREILMAQIAGALNGVATKLAIGINEVPSGLARSLKQHSESSES